MENGTSEQVSSQSNSKKYNDDADDAVTVNKSSTVQTETKEMLDVTDLFRECTSCLTVTDPMLCNKDSFSLQDAMAALEILDTKMDCCEIPASQVAPFGRLPIATTGGNHKERMVYPRPAPIGLDDIIDPLPWNELSLEDAAYISLECLVRLESLLGGASVVESTFTCLYAHHPVMVDMKARLDTSFAVTSLTEQMQKNLNVGTEGKAGTPAQIVVYASILLLLELTDVIRGIILNADIFEEEDFTVSTYGVSVFEDRDENSAIQATKLAMEYATKEGKGSDAGRAISLILGFELDLLSVCSSMARLSGKVVTKQVEQAQTLAKVAAAKLEDLLTVVKRLKGSEPESIKALLRKTFDSYVTRPLVGNAPVRKVIFSDAVESVSSLTKITKGLDWALCRTILKGNSLGRIRRMLSRLSISSVNILSRSLLVLNLYFDDKLFGQHSLSDLILQHMQQLSHIPDEVFQNIASTAFLNRLAKPIYDVMKVMLLNRNRQRAYIEAVMFPDWAALSQEAGIVDITLKKDPKFGPDFPPHFSIYTLYFTIDSMDHYVALAIELNLMCSDYELAAAYWYRDFLLSALINQLATMRKNKAEAKQIQQAQQASVGSVKRGKKKGGKNPKKNQVNGSHKLDPEDAEDDFDFMVANLRRVLCRGLVRFFAGINQAGLVPETKFEFTSKKRVFEKRFEQFAPIPQPPPLRYADYLAGSDFSKVPPKDLIESTSECFQAAKAYVDRLATQCQTIPPEFLVLNGDELKLLTKVIIGNSVYAQKLRQRVLSADTISGAKDTEKVEFDTEAHPQFCTIKIG